MVTQAIGLSILQAFLVRVGFRSKTPRVQAVFKRKTRWRKYQEECEWRDAAGNYVSAQDHATVVQLQFYEEEKLGAILLRIDVAAAQAMFG